MMNMLNILLVDDHSIVRQGIRTFLEAHSDLVVVGEAASGKDTPNVFTELSNREMEVLRLIAHGEGNTAIAEKLSISEQTVKGHVSNILGKLHIADRTQAAVFAWQQGVVHRDNATHS